MRKWRLEHKSDFYKTLEAWWKDWGFPTLPYHSVPNKIFVCYHETKEESIDLYALPVYSSDVALCWIGFPTGNKSASRELKEGALDYLMDKVETAVKYEGYKTIITTSNTPKLMKLFNDRGFTTSDEGVNYYTKIL